MFRRKLTTNCLIAIQQSLYQRPARLVISSDHIKWNEFSRCFTTSVPINSPQKINVTFIQPDGVSTKVVQAFIGESLLQTAHRNEIDLEGACEGGTFPLASLKNKFADNILLTCSVFSCAKFVHVVHVILFYQLMFMIVYQNHPKMKKIC